MRTKRFLNCVTAVVATVFLASCTNLQHVVDFSVASGKTMSNHDVADGIVSSIGRRHDLRGKTSVVSSAPDNSKRLIHVQDVYVAYFKAIGALAAKDLVTYKSQFDTFETFLSKSSLATASEAKAIGSAGDALTTMAMDAYRQERLATILKAADKPLQRHMALLIRITETYKSSLDQENLETASAIEEMHGANEDRIDYLLNDLASRRRDVVAAEKKKANAFQKALAAIAKGHHALKEDSEKLSAEETVAAIQQYQKMIVDAFADLKS
jgi:hypothetical protein